MMGLLVGGIIWGIMGDKKGRLSVLFGSILIYSIANIGNGFVMNITQYALLRFIAGFGLLTMAGVFWRMQRGFGPFNLRVTGIVLIATFASLLGLREGGSLTAAMGILGAIVGYLFGLKDSAPQQ